MIAAAEKKIKIVKDIEGQIEPYFEEEKILHCCDCKDFIQCECGECGICCQFTNWFARDIAWTAADEECMDR